MRTKVTASYILTNARCTLTNYAVSPVRAVRGVRLLERGMEVVEMLVKSWVREVGWRVGSKKAPVN